MSKTLDFKVNFEVPAKIIYRALIDPQEVMTYTRAPCVVEPKAGGIYRILDGYISGEFKNLVESQCIELTWKFNDWAAYSNVVITLTEGSDDNCEVRIVQTEIPSSYDIKKLEDGWRGQIFVPMSKIRGYPLGDQF